MYQYNTDESRLYFADLTLATPATISMTITAITADIIELIIPCLVGGILRPKPMKQPIEKATSAINLFFSTARIVFGAVNWGSSLLRTMSKYFLRNFFDAVINEALEVAKKTKRIEPVSHTKP